VSETNGWTRRMFLERGALAATALTLPGALSACGSDGGGEGSATEIAFSHANSGTPVATAVQEFASERAKQVDAKMLFGNPQLREDVQVQEVETWITQGVPAMCVFPVVVESVLPLVQRAREKDIVFTSYALKLDGANGAVLFSHEESGRALGEHAVGWITEHLGGRGKALLLGARSASPDLQPRVEIPRQLLTEQTDVTIVGEQDATDPTKGLQVTEAVLRSHPDLDIVIGLNDDGALGAMRAFINAGKDPSKVYIGGQDGGLEALQAIQDGGFYKASAALSLRDIGRAVVDLNAELLESGGERDVDVPIKLIAQDRTEHLEQALTEWRQAQ
jgi:ribose transport system substrate-binding protein